MRDGYEKISLHDGITRKIGEVFDMGGRRIIVVKDTKDMRRGLLPSCYKCALLPQPCGDYEDITGYCGSWKRKDGKDVHFEWFDEYLQKGGKK